MNRILLTICFISISFIGFSQDKGYYSIGNNAEKLKIPGDRKAVDSLHRAEKGYYDIVPNRGKLRRSLYENSLYYRRLPEINKGYYSIGNNARQLR